MFCIVLRVLGEEWLWGVNFNEILRLSERVVDYLNYIYELGMQWVFE